jgi:hypothetical protein
MSGGGRSSKPDCPIDKTIPGWRDIVEPYKQDAVFWHGVWQSADRPSHGELKNIMTRTRNQYHYAIRRVKKMANTLRARNLLQASETSSCELLKEMKKLKGSNKDTSDLPSTVGGVSGEDNIVEKFKDVYSALYNSSESSVDLSKLKDQLRDEISVDSLHEVNKITGQSGKEAAC